MKQRSKKGPSSHHKFEEHGVDFNSKLIGIADVEVPGGDDICQAAMTELKATAMKNHREKKTHKQRITVNITLKGIRLVDESSERIEHAHPIQRISFISHDQNDKRTFSYIVGTKDGYKLFAIKNTKEAKQITSTLQELFQEVFRRVQEKQEKIEDNAEGTEEAAEENKVEEEKKVDELIETAEETVVAEEASKNTNGEIEDYLDQIWKLNNDLQKMPNLNIPHSESFEDLDEPFTVDEGNKEQSQKDGFVDAFASIQAQTKPTLLDVSPTDPFEENQSIDLFSLTDDVKPVSDSSSDLFNTSSSNDLFGALEPVPITTTTNTFSRDLLAVSDIIPANDGSTVNEEPLLKENPFDEMKKTISDLHQQNMNHQRQQQQQAFMNGINPFMQQHAASNPFMPSSNTNPSPVLARPTPAAASPRFPRTASGTGFTRTASNPFIVTKHQSSNDSKPQTGWTVLETTPMPKKQAAKHNTIGTDAFAFLDNTTSMMTPSKPIASPPTNQVNGNNDIFDLL